MEARHVHVSKASIKMIVHIQTFCQSAVHVWQHYQDSDNEQDYSGLRICISLYCCTEFKDFYFIKQKYHELYFHAVKQSAMYFTNFYTEWNMW